VRYSDFEGSPSGWLVPTVFNAQAYVPNPLPPKLDLAAVALVLADAMVAIGELRGACRRLVNPYVLIRPLQRLEAQTSSAMEGTHTTNAELVLAEADVEKNPSFDVIEVRNYIRALSWAESELARLPISGRLIKGAHERLLRNVGRGRGQDKRPGEYKRDQNMIGGLTLDLARFIPPPPKEAESAMSDLEKFIHRADKSGSSPLIDMALVHCQFETIHPFADGNGRVGRMLISLMAITEGLLEYPVLYMSPELERRRDAYIDLMYAVSSKGHWEDWISFFLTTLAQSARRTVSTIDRVLSLQTAYRDRVSAVSRSSNMLAVVDMLFDSPVVRARQVSEKLGVTDAAARNMIRQLTELHILAEMPGRYPTFWIAPEVTLVSEP
jgi:Fic family protein